MRKNLNYDENRAGIDLKYILKFLKSFSWLIKLLRYNSINDNSIDQNSPTMYLVNHGQGFWGIIDVIIALDYWYNKRKFTTPLYLISEEIVFKIPIIKYLAIKAGLKNASRQNIEFLLSTGASVLIPPGGDGELIKPVWMKNRPVFTKSIYINGKMKLKTQTWFLDSALKTKIPIVPLSISGTHEMTPILYTSFLIHKYSGMAYLRRNEFLPGYPITINHFVNLGLFLLTPFSESLLAWIIFILSHIYIDFLYTYPIVFRKICIKFSNAINIANDFDYMQLKQCDRKIIRLKYLKQIDKSIREGLKECDNKRADIFTKIYNLIFRFSFVTKIWKKILLIMQKIYMKRYSNFEGDFNEYFIK